MVGSTATCTLHSIALPAPIWDNTKGFYKDIHCTCTIQYSLYGSIEVTTSGTHAPNSPPHQKLHVPSFQGDGLFKSHGKPPSLPPLPKQASLLSRKVLIINV